MVKWSFDQNNLQTQGNSIKILTQFFKEIEKNLKLHIEAFFFKKKDMPYKQPWKKIKRVRASHLRFQV